MSAAIHLFIAKNMPPSPSLAGKGMQIYTVITPIYKDTRGRDHEYLTADNWLFKSGLFMTSVPHF